jgi:hypothetical protein
MCSIIITATNPNQPRKPLCPPFFQLWGYPGSAKLVLGCPPFFLLRGYPGSAKLVVGRAAPVRSRRRRGGAVR